MRAAVKEAERLILEEISENRGAGEMPDTRRQRVNDGRAVYVGVGGRKAVLIGACMAVFGMSMAFGMSSGPLTRVLTGICIGGMMAGVGIFLAYRGARDLRGRDAASILGQALSGRKRDPMRSVVHSGWKEAGQSWAVTGCVLALVIPATAGMLAGGVRGSGPIWVAWLVVGIFDFIALALVRASVLKTLPCLRGKADSAITFSRYPFRLGEEFSAVLTLPEKQAAGGRVKLTLRFVREQVEHRVKARGETEDHLESYQEYADTAEIKDLPAGATEVPVSFRLPEGPYEPDFSGPAHSYWELVMETGAGAFLRRAEFQLPISPKKS